MTDCCEKFVEWTGSIDEYIWFDSKINKWRGDGYMPYVELIFNHCPFCGAEIEVDE